jgi:hypothetical protein
MKIETHTRLHHRLHHDYERYFDSGKKATDQERSVLHQVLRGIENAIEILDGLPLEGPGLPTLDVVVPPEDTERWGDKSIMKLVPLVDVETELFGRQDDTPTEADHEFIQSFNPSLYAEYKSAYSPEEFNSWVFSYSHELRLELRGDDDPEFERNHQTFLKPEFTIRSAMDYLVEEGFKVYEDPDEEVFIVEHSGDRFGHAFDSAAEVVTFADQVRREKAQDLAESDPAPCSSTFEK